MSVRFRCDRRPPSRLRLIRKAAALARIFPNPRVVYYESIKRELKLWLFNINRESES